MIKLNISFIIKNLNKSVLLCRRKPTQEEREKFEENFNYEKNFFPCFDLFNELVLKQTFPKNFINKLIKFLDNDKDGFISIINIINFLLHQLKHRSTKLLLKFLYNKI